MTDRISSLTVVLNNNMRTDDADPIMQAIMQLRGVISVTGNVSNLGEHVAQERVRRELTDKLWAVLHPEVK